MHTAWKMIAISSVDSPKKIIKDLKNNGYNVSLWIEDVFLNKKNKIKLLVGNYNFYWVKVSDLGFDGPFELYQIYDKLIKINFKFVPLLLSLYLRLNCGEQING